MLAKQVCQHSIGGRFAVVLRCRTSAYTFHDRSDDIVELSAEHLAWLQLAKKVKSMCVLAGLLPDCQAVAQAVCLVNAEIMELIAGVDSLLKQANASLYLQV